ncbi:tRNA ligase [Perkinsus chesapeaki]|uniref:DNA ligase n=1 Tax=Perkinsus chesapeaki TaxID=330153 RepID=A0A7J6MUT7_PERCH|nr:tRNA ligase [Perkinsus chesapeaki]
MSSSSSSSSKENMSCGPAVNAFAMMMGGAKRSAAHSPNKTAEDNMPVEKKRKIDDDNGVKEMQDEQDVKDVPADTVVDDGKNSDDEEVEDDYEDDDDIDAMPLSEALKQPGKTDAEKLAQVAKGTGPLSIWKVPASAAKNPTAISDITSPAFDPSKFSQIKLTPGKNLPYSLLALALQKIEDLKNSGQGSKKKVLVILSNLFRVIIYYNPSELIYAVYLLINKLRPDYENVEVGVGDHVILKAMAQVYGRSEKHITADISNGNAADLGEAALLSRVNQPMLFAPPPLTISKLYKELLVMSQAKGKDSQKLRKDIITKCLVAAKGEEAKYIVRTLQGRLRVGILSATILQALAYAFVLTKPAEGKDKECIPDIRKEKPSPSNEKIALQMMELEAATKQAFCEVPSYDKLVECLLSGADAEKLAQVCTVTPGIPVKPMLAKPTKSITEVLDRFKDIKFTAEYKYDGERAQVHMWMNDKGKRVIKVYSRNSEDLTEKYPDVIDAIEVMLSTVDKPINNMIIDAEAVAFDREKHKVLPFQMLSSRPRKNVDISDIKVQVCLFPFDLIYLDDESLITKNLDTRRTILRTRLKEVDDRIQFATARDMDSEEEIQLFFTESVEASCEGLMLKTLIDHATYEPSKRSLNWLKLKKDYLTGMADSLDLVPIGAFYGKGKRTGVYGTYLLAVYDANEGEYQSCCKVATGFTDEFLDKHYDHHKENVIPRKRADYVVADKMTPDVWLDATQVWEIQCADLSISPVHTGACNLIDSAGGKGIGLRFPRFIRIRDDKNPEDATSSEQVCSTDYHKGDNFAENPSVLRILCQNRRDPPCYVASTSLTTVVGFIAATIDQPLLKELEKAVRTKMKKSKTKGIFGFIHQVEAEWVSVHETAAIYVAVASESQEQQASAFHSEGVTFTEFFSARTFWQWGETPDFLAMVLHVEHTNTGAIKLYKRLGFIEVLSKLEKDVLEACPAFGKIVYRNYEKGDNYPDNPAALTIQCQTRNDPPCYVAVNSDSGPNTVIGFVVATIGQPLSKEVENAVRRKMKKPKTKGIFGFIHQVAVTKDSQGKGIGTHLLDYMINLGKSTPNFLAMVLYVDHDNLGAIKLYKRLGFIEVLREGSEIYMALYK